MVATLDDTKRMAIAAKLADMQAMQSLIVSNEQTLLSECHDEEINKRLREMLESDQKNLGIIETVMVQYGNKADANEVTQKFVSHAREMFGGSTLTLYEKFAQHELLKHGQVMTGIVIHKAAQIVGADVEAAITPLNTVNFENRAHQEQLKGILESVGTRELTGQEADQGLWARVQDAVAAMSGVAGSVLTQSSDKEDMGIRGIIRMDHAKANTLFTQILGSDNPQKIQEYFGQLYKDLTVHAEAEEQVVYPGVRSFYSEGDVQELFDEQAEMKSVLNQLKSMDPSSAEFKNQVKQLMNAVGDHIRQEESTMFGAIRDNMSDQQQEQMATEFKAAKSQLQEQLAASM